MTSFADQLMVRYLDPADVEALLVPPADTSRQRVRALLGGVYQPQLLAVEAVDEVTVTATRFQVPVVEPVRADGILDQLSPSPGSRTQLTVELPALGDTLWLDLMIDAVVRVRVSSSAALLAGVAAEDVSGLSEPDFVARFEFLDLPALMAASGVHTYAELQARFPQLFKLHYADPPVYDPDDPGVLRTYRLRVSGLFFPTLDLVEALRRLTRTRRALDAATPTCAEYEGGALLGASAWLAVFPADAVGAGTPTRPQIEALFGADHVVAAFETV
jgi:hypothetical protein